MFLSGVIGEEVQNGHVTKVPDLSSTIEETDERLFTHINHAVKTINVKSILITSSDIDVFQCAIYCYCSVLNHVV